MTRILRLILSLAIPLAIGAIAGMFTTDAIPGWYASLNRPAINPPNWVFGPVWTLLYILMGISLFLIWSSSPSRQRNLALAIFFIQLLLNFLWSFLFFYFRVIGLALVEIVILWLSIILMICLFRKIKPMAAYLNIPYLLWVSFATILNAAYFHLN
ncbi:MAG: TspO/MBR family protein [bacterium]